MRTAKKYELFQNNPQTKKETRPEMVLHTATRKVILLIVCGSYYSHKDFYESADNGMFPAIKGGDLLIGFRLQRNFLKNDVVVYKANGETAGRKNTGTRNECRTIR